jgi:indolepyruvate ferredoxin oxidoreductase
VEFLTGYQNAAYAAEYKQPSSSKVQQAESPLGKHGLTEAVARYLFKLMAYKDEYEVARLHTDRLPARRSRACSRATTSSTTTSRRRIVAKKNDKGELQKQKFGPWMLTGFRLLAKLKGLRGTALDIFGRTEERKTERALIGEYRASIEEVMAGLRAGNHALALEIAGLPEQIRGYGHVKDRNLAAARSRWSELMGKWRDPQAARGGLIFRPLERHHGRPLGARCY